MLITKCATRRWMSSLSMSSSSSSTAIARRRAVTASVSTTAMRSASTTTTTTTIPSFQTKFVLPDPSIPHESYGHLPLTKIVATIGPTSEQAEPLLQCTRAGMNIMRLNFSHATHEEVELRCANLKRAVKIMSPPNASVPIQDNVGILLDTKGPEIRSGKLLNDVSGHDTIELVAGNTITLHATTQTLPNNNNNNGSTEADLFIDFPPLAQVLEPGRQVLLDDGAVVMTVLNTHPEKNTVTAQIQNTGRIRSRAGVNLPLANTAEYLPALSEKDKADIAYGMETADIDFIAASFVQTAQHVIDIRKHCAQVAQQLPHLWKNKPLPLIISKIETASALTHFDEILDASDAIMVARGDLGVEIPIQQVTNAQKEMCAACNAAGKPVVVATQMLESMSKAPRPTRAEVADVTNAVYDGADCVMCSGETAKGKYPDTTIRIMREIILCSERYSSNMKALGRPIHHDFLESPKTMASAIAKAAVTASIERHNCAAILVLLQPLDGTNRMIDPTGQTPTPFSLPGLVAAHRPNVPIITFTQSVKQARQLQIFRGIHPVLITPTSDILAEAKKMGYVAPGDEVVLVQEEEQDPHGSGTPTASMKIVPVPP